ncbi:MAG: hypothetical protein JO157_07290 [Acetobacteraceae bacterium]|nr:hypothetical protein [Acetobacteraceae bacterium]
MDNATKILVVVTSHGEIDDAPATGIWFTEFSEPYQAFLDVGADVIVASPRGGPAPVDHGARLPGRARPSPELTVMRYAMLCTVNPSKLDLFAALRAEHYRFLIARRDQIVFGGPARAAEGGRPETMIIVVEAPSQADAERFIAEEPYSRHGGFSHVVVRPWSQIIPEAEPGALERILEAEVGQRSAASASRLREN